MSARYRFHMHLVVVGAQLVAISTFASAIVLDVTSLETSVLVSSVCFAIIVLATISRSCFLDTGEQGIRIGTTPFRGPVVLSDRDLLGGVRLAGLAGTDDIARTIATQEIEIGKGLVLLDCRGSDDTRAAVMEAARRSGRTDEVVVLDFADGGRRGTHAMSTLVGLPDEAFCRLLLGMHVRRGGLREATISAMRASDGEFLTFSYAMVGLLPAVREEVGSRAARGEVWPSLTEIVRASRREGDDREKILRYLDSLPFYDPDRGEDQRRDLTRIIDETRKDLRDRWGDLCRHLGGPLGSSGCRIDLGRHLADGRIVHVILPPDEDRARDRVIASILVEHSLLAMQDASERRGSIVTIDLPERWAFLAKTIRRTGWGIVQNLEKDGDGDDRVLVVTRCEIAIPGIDASRLGRLRPGRAVVARGSDRLAEFTIDKAASMRVMDSSPLSPMLPIKGGMYR